MLQIYCSIRRGIDIDLFFYLRAELSQERICDGFAANHTAIPAITHYQLVMNDTQDPYGKEDKLSQMHN